MVQEMSRLYWLIAKSLYDMNYRGPVGLESFASNNPELALERFEKAFTIDL